MPALPRKVCDSCLNHDTVADELRLDPGVDHAFRGREKQAVSEYNAEDWQEPAANQSNSSREHGERNQV